MHSWNKLLERVIMCLQHKYRLISSEEMISHDILSNRVTEV